MKGLKRVLPPGILRRLQQLKAEWIDEYAVKSYAQEGEDLILRRIFADAKSGFYVDVGACHPKRFSNTFWFYGHGWRGINVEPNPDALRLFLRERRRDINIGAGVSDEEGALQYYMFNEPALNSFDRELSEKRQNDRYRIVATRRVPVRRLDRILQEHIPSGTRIDFLSVDVEGFDLRVLSSNDWQRFRPICLLVEAHDVYLDRLADCAVHAFAVGRGYGLFAKTASTLFYRDLQASDTVEAGSGSRGRSPSE